MILTGGSSEVKEINQIQTRVLNRIKEQLRLVSPHDHIVRWILSMEIVSAAFLQLFSVFKSI